MAILKGHLLFNIKELNDLAAQFPDFGGRLLAYFGKRGREILKEEYLSGQELNLRVFPNDSIGRRTITSDTNKQRTKTDIYSYPVNLFEKGRRLRDGRKEPGKKIITVKLKQDIASRAASYVSDFERRVIEPEIKKAGF